MKTYLHPFRLATYLLVLYCLGHSFGALVSTPHFGPQADAVLTAMKSVRFDADGAVCSWYGFYLGFGWSVSIFFLLSAVVTWCLGGASLREQKAWAPVAWALFASYAGSTYLAWRWFFVAPLVFSVLITVLLGVGCVRLARAEPA